jgi:MerR family transcriptional regulator, light-induced transcriptional regulator
MDDQSPTPAAEAVYNIGAVTRLTGIPVTTLHAWERRYGFPHPSGRTAGGHRLYTEKDVTLLRYVKAQIKSGLAARLAVSAVLKMDNEGRLLTNHPIEIPRAANLFAPSPAGREQLTEALFRHDLRRADQLMGEMLAFSSPEEITLSIIGPVLAELGEAWEAGRISVPDEHLASNYLRQRLLMWMVSGPPQRAANPIVLACAPGEWHEGSLLMLGVLLRRQGWPVAYLGQAVPFADLAVFVRQVNAQALALVGMLEGSARALADWPKWIQPSAGKPLVAFAGRAFVIQPELKDDVPGIYLGDTVQEGLAKLEGLLRENQIVV